MATTPDGPRFVASLQKPDDLVCFKDFFETETLKEAKEEAEKAANKTNRKALVFDRKEHDIVHRFTPEGYKEPEVVKTEVRGTSPLSRKSKKTPKVNIEQRWQAKVSNVEKPKSKSSKYFD